MFVFLSDLQKIPIPQDFGGVFAFIWSNSEDFSDRETEWGKTCRKRTLAQSTVLSLVAYGHLSNKVS